MTNNLNISTFWLSFASNVKRLPYWDGYLLTLTYVDISELGHYLLG